MAENYATRLKSESGGLSLHEHQILGVKHILQWCAEEHGGIIADEMGLGKTCQAVAAIVCLLNDNKAGRHMIICPLSVLQHWQNELFRFGLRKLRIVVYIGNADARKVIREKLQNSQDWNVLVTTYEMLISDEQYFHQSWSSLFVDEAHRLKSNKSVLHQIVRKMSVELMVLITGTPVQNNINELYSLLSLIDANRFSLPEEEQFVAKYPAAELQHILSKYLIRRTKQMLRIDIPDSSELNIEDKKTQHAGNRVSLLNVLMQLRKCVAHPYLLMVIFNCIEPEPFKEGDHLFQVSGKFFLLDRLLTFLAAKGHRYNYQRLDGSVRAEERFSAVNRFQVNSDIFCFLLSTRAGGLGLNLTAGDTACENNTFDCALYGREYDSVACNSEASNDSRYFGGENDANKSTRKELTFAEISDMIIKGLNRLNNEKTDFEELNMEEIEKLVGKTDENNHWIHDANEQIVINTGWEKNNGSKSNEQENGVLENMYIFEGHDYKQDFAVLQNILVESKAREIEDISVGQTVEKRARKQISKEEMQERVKKRKETLDWKKKLKEQETERRRKERETRKAMKWFKNNYKSGALPFQEVPEVQHVESNTNFGPHFVYGSVIDTQKLPMTIQIVRLLFMLWIIVVNFGSVFGHGGVFDALRRKNQLIVNTYELAGRMGDLHLGDAHLIEDIADELPITLVEQDERSRDNNDNDEAEQSTSKTFLSRRKISVVLLVAQHYRRRDVIDQDILAKCLKKLSFYAISSNILSIHMPRIGYDKRNVSWYAVERLINRILNKNRFAEGNVSKRPVSTQINIERKKCRMNDKAESDFEIISANASFQHFPIGCLCYFHDQVCGPLRREPPGSPE
ncbi:hypothetical protein DINM_022310 [Dirofilaria immitis]|nr:hypothetical protein [Dirofilaria immitis]